MADKKISALTASTTPLAGTEVLPIVQGGATVKVAVSDLTAGRAFSALSSTFSGQTLTAATATPIMDLSATWNTSGTPSAFKLNVTDTASNASSLLLNLQVGGTVRASVSKSGNIANTGSIISTQGGYSRTLDNTGLFIVTPSGQAGTVRITQTGIQDWQISNVASSGNLSIGGHVVITPQGNVRLGTASLATTATNGFAYIPTCAGVPTGVPSTQTGYAPMVADSTNNKLYMYLGGSWVAMN